MRRPTATARLPALRQPLGDVSGGWGTVLTGLMGAAILVALSLVVRAALIPALVGAVVVALTGAGVAVLQVRSGRRKAAARASTEPTRDGGDPLAFQPAIERLPAPLLLVSASDENGARPAEILYANAAARQLLRVSREGDDLTSAFRDPQVLEAVDESLFGGLTRTVTLEFGGAQERVWSVWTAPLEPESDRRRMATLFMRDETELRRAERLRADFLANASHELRTPLASLTGFIETLRGHAKDDPVARDKFLTIMAAQGQRMGRLIDDLLSLSRIELNEHVPPSGTCDLGQAVRDTLDALSPVAAERGVGVNLAGGEFRAVVAGDRDQIVQVVQNLVDNALKYSPRGGAVSVELTTDLSLDVAQSVISSGAPGEGGGRMSLLNPDRRADERFALLRVSDRGPGMRREHLPRLSERFYRVEGQKSGARAGTGLGLAIVKHIVNRHRGGLTVQSAPGAGATFSVYLPLSRARASAVAGAGAGAETKLS